MERSEQLARFTNDLESLLARYAFEYDITGVEVIGVLHCCAHRIANNVVVKKTDPPRRGPSDRPAWPSDPPPDFPGGQAP